MKREGKEIKTPSPSEFPVVERTKSARVYLPMVDIRETKEMVTLIFDMPGADEQTVNVTIDRNVLTVTGAVEPPVYQGYKCVYSEFNVGDYQRSFTIAEDIDRDKVEASIRNGVLRLTLPRMTQQSVKKIAIKSH